MDILETLQKVVFTFHSFSLMGRLLYPIPGELEGCVCKLANVLNGGPLDARLGIKQELNRN